MTKPINIPKQLVMQAYKLVKANAEASMFIQKIAKRQSDLFVHWRHGMFGEFV